MKPITGSDSNAHYEAGPGLLLGRRSIAMVLSMSPIYPIHRTGNPVRTVRRVMGTCWWERYEGGTAPLYTDTSGKLTGFRVCL